MVKTENMRKVYTNSTKWKFEIPSLTKCKINFVYQLAKYVQHKIEKSSFLKTFEMTFKHCFYLFWRCCFNVNKVFSKSKMDANKTLANANWVIKRKYYIDNVISAKAFHVTQSERHSKKSNFFP